MTDMKRWIEDHFEEHKALLKRFAAIPAPSGSEDGRVRFLMEYISALGYEPFTDEAKNVLVRLGGEGRAACFMAHTDVVFPDTEPLPVREEGGRLFAPGIGDNSADVCAMLTMLKYFREHGMEPKSPLLFVFDSCEEGLGNLKGVRRVMSDHGDGIESVVCFDCSLDEGLITRAVGSERWRVACTTRGGHSFAAFGSPSAIHRTAELITKLYVQALPEKPGSRTTYNAGVITGGTSVNTIAQRCEMLYEYRSDDHECLGFMRKQLEELLAGADCEEAHFEAELIGERPCGKAVDEKALAALITRCEDAIVSVTGEKPARSAGSTDANIPLSLGVPAVTFGLLIGEGAHTREEWLYTDSLKIGLEIGLKLLCDNWFR